MRVNGGVEWILVRTGEFDRMVAFYRDVLRLEIVTPTLSDGQGWAWTYVRAPDGTIYQIQGPDPAADPA